ncbi:MAG: type II toxin-antitoxin system prevent-host-death family antitoxin [Ignavibacteriae bacterium]|nr:type II toxin-antitoxin system prevent-host-death family antitoxin [Ignavibacteriota bacterium]
METIAISELRANLMKFINEVKNGSSISVTSRGKIVAKIVPPEVSKKNANKKLKELRKTAIIHDVISPIDENWEVT